MSTYLAKYRESILNGEPFRDAQSYGYQTEGGTYIIGSSAFANDDGVDHDLMAITMALDVFPLRATAYIVGVRDMILGITEPEPVQELEAERPLDRSRGGVTW